MISSIEIYRTPLAGATHPETTVRQIGKCPARNLILGIDMALFPYPFLAVVNFPTGIDQEEPSDTLVVQPLFMNQSSNLSDPPEFVTGE